jgi:hypothetical protein
MTAGVVLAAIFGTEGSDPAPSLRGSPLAGSNAT